MSEPSNRQTLLGNFFFKAFKLPFLCYSSLQFSMQFERQIITDVSVLRWFLIFLIWRQHCIGWCSILKHWPLIFFDHSFVTIHQYDGQLRIDICSPWCTNHHYERNKVLSQFSSLKCIKRPCFLEILTENMTHQKWKPIDDSRCQLTDRLALIIDKNW